MKNLTLLLAILLISGCATWQKVDAKGRDCEGHWVYPLFFWETCEDDQEPLAVQRQEVKVDVTATIEDKTVEPK